MTVEEMARKAAHFDCDEIFAELEKKPPRFLSTFFFALEKELYRDADEHEEKCLYDEWKHKLSSEQYEKWQWLNSTKREREYLLSIPEDQMTDQDWFDLRACDF